MAHKWLFDLDVSPRIIEVLSPTTDITIQELYSEIRALEDEPCFMSYEKLISGAGKEDLGGGKYVGITVTLQNAKLKFEDRAGPSYVQCTVSGGNLTAVDDVGNSMDPIETSAFTQVVIIQSTSPAIIENDKAAIADAVWDESKSDHSSAGSIGKAVQDIETDTEFIKSVEAGRWRIVDNQMIFYEEDNSTEIARFNLFDKNGNPAMEKVYERQRV